MKIWILNHYATNMYFDGTGRHHSLAKYLIRKGHEVKIFCASTVHNSEQEINLNGKLFLEKIGMDNVPYVFIQTSPYHGNGKDRIKNMVEFYRNVKKTINNYIEKELPDSILASSVHPLTLVAGIQSGKKYSIPCICEVRDLWPETLIRFGKLNRKSLIAKLLYRGEKWIYKKATALIFTMEGSIQYLIDRQWQNAIDLNKVYYINNGVDLDAFYDNKAKYQIKDADLTSEGFKIVYTGTIGEANRVDALVDVAERLQENSITNVKIIIFGSGLKENELKSRVKYKGLKNITFKGRVEKKYIPYILSKADANVLLLVKNGLEEYGISLNKSFEYLASRRPIIMDSTCRYNYIEENNCAIINTDLYQAIVDLTRLDNNEYQKMRENASNAAQCFDYKTLADKLEKIIIQYKGEFRK